MTDTTQTPLPDDAAAAAGSNLDQAVEAAQQTEQPIVSAVQTSEPSLAELESMSPEELDKMLTEGTKPVEKQEAAPAASTSAPAGEKDSAGDEDPEDPEAAGQMVPRARLNQEVQKRRALEQEREQLLQDRAYMAGKADAAATAPKEPEVDPEAIVSFNIKKLGENFNDNILKLAQQFDDGEITAIEWERKKQDLNAKYNEYHGQFTAQLQQIQDRKNAPNPQMLAEQLGAHRGLAAHTKQLEDANPWMGHVKPELAKAMTKAAEEILAQHQIFLPKNFTLQDLADYTADLRTAMVEVGRAWDLDKIAAPAATTTPASAGPQKADPSQIRSKLDLARQQPPLTSSVGAGLPTDAMAAFQPENRSVDDLAKLSPKELDALIERESKKAA